MEKRTIYVYLLNEGIDVWRPVEAVHEHDDVYRITGENPDPEDENWEFKTHQRVLCEHRELSRGPASVAYRLADEN